MQVPVKNLRGEAVGEAELADAVFALPVRADILQRVVTWQLAKRRAGTHSTKSRSEINRTGAKMYKQKGTGRARHGSRRVNIFRGGAPAFGPKPRDHAFDLPKQVRRLGLKTALSSKIADGKLVLLDDARIDEPKTKVLKGHIDALEAHSVLFVTAGEPERNFALASRNLPLVQVLPQEGANVYDILRRDLLVITQDAAKLLEERLS